MGVIERSSNGRVTQIVRSEASPPYQASLALAFSGLPDGWTVDDEREYTEYVRQFYRAIAYVTRPKPTPPPLLDIR
jgi:hypothetical protein